MANVHGIDLRNLIVDIDPDDPNHKYLMMGSWLQRAYYEVWRHQPGLLQGYLDSYIAGEVPGKSLDMYDEPFFENLGELNSAYAIEMRENAELLPDAKLRANTVVASSSNADTGTTLLGEALVTTSPMVYGDSITARVKERRKSEGKGWYLGWYQW